MSATVGLQYDGLKEALRDLQKVSPALRLKLSKEMLEIVRETMVAPNNIVLFGSYAICWINDSLHKAPLAFN